MQLVAGLRCTPGSIDLPWVAELLPPTIEDAPFPKLHFSTRQLIVEQVELGGCLADHEGSLKLAQGLAMERGGIYLSLTDEQYAKLKR
jgi:hypothetical protein